MDMPGVETLDANYALLTGIIAIILLALTPWADHKRNFLKVKRWTAIELCIAVVALVSAGAYNYSLKSLVRQFISSSTPLFSACGFFAV